MFVFFIFLLNAWGAHNEEDSFVRDIKKCVEISRNYSAHAVRCVFESFLRNQYKCLDTIDIEKFKEKIGEMTIPISNKDKMDEIVQEHRAKQHPIYIRNIIKEEDPTPFFGGNPSGYEQDDDLK